MLHQNIFLITPFSNTFNLCSSVNIEGQVSHPYAISGVIIVLSSKGHPNNILFADKNTFYVQKSTSSNCNSTFSLPSVFNTQTVRHVLRTLEIFFCISMTDELRFTKKHHKCHPTALYIDHLPTHFTYCYNSVCTLT
jgi:hypothetical protein